MTSMANVSDSSCFSSAPGSVFWRVRTARRVSRSDATAAAQILANASHRAWAEGSWATMGSSWPRSWLCARACKPLFP